MVQLLANGGFVNPNNNSICIGNCLTSDTIINPTAAQRALPGYFKPTDQLFCM
jgi:hypothetical protein